MLKLTRNNTFGQHYLENTQTGEDLRIPRQNTRQFWVAAKLCPADIQLLREGCTVWVEGDLDDYQDLAG